MGTGLARLQTCALCPPPHPEPDFPSGRGLPCCSRPLPLSRKSRSSVKGGEAVGSPQTPTGAPPGAGAHHRDPSAGRQCRGWYPELPESPAASAALGRGGAEGPGRVPQRLTGRRLQGLKPATLKGPLCRHKEALSLSGKLGHCHGDMVPGKKGSYVLVGKGCSRQRALVHTGRSPLPGQTAARLCLAGLEVSVTSWPWGRNWAPRPGGQRNPPGYVPPQECLGLVPAPWHGVEGFSRGGMVVGDPGGGEADNRLLPHAAHHGLHFRGRAGGSGPLVQRAVCPPAPCLQALPCPALGAALDWPLQPPWGGVLGAQHPLGACRASPFGCDAPRVWGRGRGQPSTKSPQSGKAPVTWSTNL